MVYLYLDPLFSLLIVHAPVVTDNVPVVDAACSISISADSVPAQTVTIVDLLFDDSDQQKFVIHYCQFPMFYQKLPKKHFL